MNALAPAAFLQQVGLPAAQSVKLMLFFDATSSRERTWKQAQTVQAEILDAARSASHSVELKVGFFRGTECRVTGWSSNPDSLAASMAKIRCQAGRTQILRLMRLAETHPTIRRVVHRSSADVYATRADRPDLLREVDLIEEVVRLHGFDKVPTTLPSGPVCLTTRPSASYSDVVTSLVGSRYCTDIST